MAMQTIRVETQHNVARVSLNRPERRNAFNAELIRELGMAFTSLDPAVRVVVLTGEGKAFCAGADLQWMQESASLGERGNAEEAAAMAQLFQTIDQTPRVVIGRINGPAIGGGLGLVACCDIVVTLDTVRFAFSEVRLGVIPAVISPFVLRKISISAARRYFLTGEQFSAERAKELGLVHEVVKAEALDATVDELARAVQNCGPVAVGEAKKLIRRVTPQTDEAHTAYTVGAIARLRVSPEAKEGFCAFLEKRPPAWAK
jgi:methylglutaconyl-CoA hydratase